MSPEELTAARQRLGLTPDALAAELDLTPAVILAWEAGRIRPTGRAQRWLLWRGAMLDRDEALAASGLAECVELRHVAASAQGDGRTRSTIVLAHVEACPTCQARKRYLADRFPPMPPPPLPLPLLALVSAQRAVEHVWQWVRTRLGPRPSA